MKQIEPLIPLSKVLHLLADISDMRDFITGSHGRRVAAFSRLIAQRIGLNLFDQEIAYYSGLVHDIGKFSVPEIILFKPTRLSETEYNLIKKHAIFTRKILEQIIEEDSRYASIVDYASQHHERLDGSGYPDALKDDSLDIIARIVAVADVFDVITARRLYSLQDTPEYVCIEFMREKTNGRLDAVVVDGLLNLEAVEVLRIINYDNLDRLQIEDTHDISDRTLKEICALYAKRYEDSISKTEEAVLNKFEYYYYGKHKDESRKL